MAILCVDLDGTLIDIRRKHYSAYAVTLRELERTPLSEHDYWRRRRQGAANSDLIGDVNDEHRQRFLSLWWERVESPAYLRLDTLVAGCRRALASLLPSYDLVLVTMRQDDASLREQLRELTLCRFFSAVYSRGPFPEVGSKAELIRRHAKKLPRDSIVVGDSEADVETARELGLVSVCVTTGVRGQRFLERLRPDHLIPSIARLPDVLSSS